MKGLTDKKPAVTLLMLMVATAVLPNLLNHSLAAPTTTVGANQTETMEASQKSHLEFAAPAGWKRIARTSKDDVSYARERNTVRVRLTKMVDNRPTAIARKVQSAALEGEHFQVNDQEISTENGFSGKSCIVSDRANTQRGNCAMLGRDEFLVVITATNPSGVDTYDLDPLVKSLTVKAAK